MEIQAIKQRFGIIGNSPLLERAIDIARQVAPTDISVLITGESGTGKEVFPKIIHQLSKRKHGTYIAVNCGAIPEGTIDSELFGHEKGAFTGAHDSRKGYFEVANGGTIFLDEVSELPLSTQVRLLRVLESGEFIKVGSSKAQKTDVRVVAATNIQMNSIIEKGKFREDLFYRLNSVPIYIPPLRERNDDIVLLFRKFAADFAEKYRMPMIKLEEDAKEILLKYRWNGNVRQLKNITEQISVIEKERHIDYETLRKYLPEKQHSELPVLFKKPDTSFSERELMYKFLFDMKKDITDLKQLVMEIIRNTNLSHGFRENNAKLIQKVMPKQENVNENKFEKEILLNDYEQEHEVDEAIEETQEYIDESLSLEKKEIDFIKKALEKHNGKRKAAANELGISERTLYRKIKEYDIKS